MSDAVHAAVRALQHLTSAAVRDADDALLDALYVATHNWHLIAAAERMRRREATAAPPDRSAPTQPQERP